ncbi:MAG: restriction endonuclease subunit M [Candidatus Accumulibacter phosphatis]|uniref:site-specific DNA-methyltransferase (adenine-specific) n=1 Tax=Candidatus Accumulibacter phosphatis TaxID=327160 RepID=A0A6A7RV01_9PROT|nr:restriction endonuclease subunit M [Candidatus Accumulibacter phosphatis]
MKTNLSREHRRILEATAAQARSAAETGAARALQALAVGASTAPAHLTDGQKKLRVRLRAHGRALGDDLRQDDTQSIDHLVAEIAYEHWHRMLFARFLAESDLLMHPDGYPVSLSDCKADAEDGPGRFDPPARSEWEVAGHYASRMLPNVFRPDSPALALQLPLETEQALEALLARLPTTVFQANDSLGWSYQFWQAPKKQEVQRQMKQAGTKVGADELPAVTQLFTEQYMVAFLLENALGGWWQGRHPEQPLPVDMPYFRKVDDGSPAAGTFPAWPASLADFRLLDPCLGSGHFLVSALHYLVPIRCATEHLSVAAAVDRVLAENLHGLELDARCVEIAAFALALAAWRYPDEQGQPLGHRPLPRLNIACVGVAPRSKKADWLTLADGDRLLEAGMAALYTLFQKAPELGSLIDPMATIRGDLLDAQWEELASRLEQALAGHDDDADSEARVAALGMVYASRILTRRYHLVITNPPYLGAGQHGPMLKDFCEEHYKAAKGDIANVFLERSLKLCAPGGSVSFVMPQNWLFLKSYQKQRQHLLNHATWNLLARLGEHGFESTDAAGAFTILLTLTHTKPGDGQMLRGIDASAPKSSDEKATSLANDMVVAVSQQQQLTNPDARVLLEDLGSGPLLSQIADFGKGSSTGDRPRFLRGFWEMAFLTANNAPWLDSPIEKQVWSGREHVTTVPLNTSQLREQLGCWLRGHNLWGRPGVAVNKMRGLEPFLYAGETFDDNVGIIAPKDAIYLPAIWVFVRSGEYLESVRKIDHKLNVTAATLTKVPFDLAHWQQVATERYPNGLPKPYSDDPTQWIFHGHPKPANDPLQVAVARLLGYCWPAESDAEMELSDESHAWIARCQDLAGLVDDDGIVCLPAVRGEAAAVDRLRALLARAFGTDWSAARESQLLRDAGCDCLPLAQWLRDKFFEQHVTRFQKRPFIWHVWDGHKEGFSALVNYHLLTREKLNTLINLYLGDWITQQRRAVDAGNADATLKLAKAEALKARLEAILEGEPPHDIFVRWKPLHQQPFGWNPDINDGVRMNIRPFVETGVLRINRAKVGIKWGVDRGKDVASAPWFKLGPSYGEPEGTRINDHHSTLAEKKAAREKAKAGT